MNCLTNKCEGFFYNLILFYSILLFIFFLVNTLEEDSNYKNINLNQLQIIKSVNQSIIAKFKEKNFIFNKKSIKFDNLFNKNKSFLRINNMSDSLEFLSNIGIIEYVVNKIKSSVILYIGGWEMLINEVELY